MFGLGNEVGAAEGTPTGGPVFRLRLHLHGRPNSTMGVCKANPVGEICMGFPLPSLIPARPKDWRDFFGSLDASRPGVGS
jgi:hypothetical protein